VRILVVGFGRVGRAAAASIVRERQRICDEYALDLELAGIVTSRVTWLPDGGSAAPELARSLTGDAVSRLAGRHEAWSALETIDRVEADLLVEATSGSVETGEPGISNVRAALRRGMHVVAASKGAFVQHWEEVRALAADRGLEVRIGAAAGAALPTLELARSGLAGARIESVDAILNGTSNYILSKMGEHGSTFEESLRDAQSVGAAEANPRMDVEGIDTACKLVIIANAALGANLRLADVPTAGITGLDPSDLERAAARGRTIRLLGTLRRAGDAWRARVEPTPLRASHPLARVGGFDKGISYLTDSMDRVTVIGGSSSPTGAAAAILRDVVNIGRDR
jgi:homoserine dehydrogenase